MINEPPEQFPAEGALPVISIQSISSVALDVTDCKRMVLLPAFNDTVALLVAHTVLPLVLENDCALLVLVQKQKGLSHTSETAPFYLPGKCLIESLLSL
jgi:hypothetical protein